MYICKDCGIAIAEEALVYDEETGFYVCPVCKGADIEDLNLQRNPAPEVTKANKEDEMKIEIKGNSYIVAEMINDWKICLSMGKVAAEIKVPKRLCGTIEELRAYLERNDGLFSEGCNG